VGEGGQRNTGDIGKRSIVNKNDILYFFADGGSRGWELGILSSNDNPAPIDPSLVSTYLPLIIKNK
jgi:hypothetical protein